MTTIAEYVRVSSEDDDLRSGNKLESNSIANQRNLLNAYIRRIPEFAGANVVEFCDDGWSGKNFERPAVQEMLLQARQGKIQCIIVKDMSRFGRDYLIVGNYISRVLPFLGVRFIAVNDGVDSIRPTDVDSLDTSFRALLYDLYSRDLSRKVRSAMRLRAKRGDCLSTYAPYGYRKDPDKKNHLVIDPPAAEIVRRVFQMAADGRSTVQIAQALNRECVPTPMRIKRAAGYTHMGWNCVGEENFWTGTEIARILRDEQYLGKVVYGKRLYDIIGQRHSVKVSRKDWIVTPDAHEPIVSQDEYDRAQAAMREFMEYKRKSKGRPVCRKIRCGICGHAMVRAERKSPYYFCHTPRMTDAFPCPPQKIPEQDIFAVLLDDLHAQAAAAVDLGRVWEERHRKEKKDAAGMRKNLVAWKGKLERQEREIKAMYESFALGEVGKADYLAAKAAAVRQRDDTAARIAQLEATLENAGADGKLQNRFVSCFEKYAEVQEITNEIVLDVLKEVVVYPNARLEVIWNYQKEFDAIVLDVMGGTDEDADGQAI